MVLVAQGLCGLQEKRPGGLRMGAGNHQAGAQACRF